MIKVKSNILHNGQEYKVGDVFEGSESEIKRLISLGALEEVSEVKEDKKDEVKDSKPTKRWNRASLMEYCRANGIEVSEEANKEELLQAIEASEATPAEESTDGADQPEE